MGVEVAEGSELKWGIWSRDPRVPRFSQRLYPPLELPLLGGTVHCFVVRSYRGRGCSAAGNEASSGIGPVLRARLL